MLPDYLTHEHVCRGLGMVIPAWYPERLSAAGVERLLTLALADFRPCCLSERVVIVVDGQPRVAEIARRVADAAGERSGCRPRVSALAENVGKGGAVAAGIEMLLDQDGVSEIVVRDADGDHFMDDVPHLFRAAAQVQGETENPRVIAVGGRANLHRPMGLVRGQFELLLNDALWQALAFALAKHGRVLDETWFAAYGAIPDLQSGFKLYSRAAADVACRGIRQAQKNAPDLDMARWGAEVVPIVELLVAGGVICQINRITMEGQPASAFENADHSRMYGNKLAWAFGRLGLDAAQACRLFDNAAARSLIGLDAGSAPALDAIRALLQEHLGGAAAGPEHRSLFC